MKQNSGKRTATKGNGVVQKTTNKNPKKKKFKNTRLFKLLRIALLLVIIIFIVNIISDLFKKTPDKVSVVIRDKKIELKNSVEVDKDNNIFISIDDIKNIYDKNIYYSNNILITTYNKHIAVLESGKTTMKVNDVVQEIKGTLKEINGVVYLPFSDMVDVYDFEESYNKDTKVLSIDSKSLEKKETVVLKSASLKEKPEAFAKTLEKVKKTQYVTVFETKGDYTKVRTKAGNIGYIKTKKLSKPDVLWEDMDEETLESVKILEEYSIVDSKYEILQNSEKNSIVTPNLFKISELEDGKIEVQKIISLEGNIFKSYKDWANGSDVTICPIVTLDGSMSKVCSSYENRSLIINTLYNDLVNNQLNMICVDFSDVDDVEGLYRFITEMMPRFKSAGMNVLVKYNSSLNKNRLNNIVDYVVD